MEIKNKTILITNKYNNEIKNLKREFRFKDANSVIGMLLASYFIELRSYQNKKGKQNE